MTCLFEQEQMGAYFGTIPIHRGISDRKCGWAPEKPEARMTSELCLHPNVFTPNFPFLPLLPAFTEGMLPFFF